MNDLIKPSNDSKTRNTDKQKNTFGLAVGPDKSCPGCTQGAGGCWHPLKEGNITNTCYVDRLCRARKNVAAVLEHNFQALKQADQEQAKQMLCAEFQRFEDEEQGNEDPCYRLHWAGDVFSAVYGKALAEAVACFPNVRFWVYTRCWDLIPLEFIELPNVAFFVSLDACNADAGLAWIESLKEKSDYAYNAVNVSYMGNVVPENIKDFAKARGLTILQCPVDSGKMELEGACQKCKACVFPRGNVIQFEI